MLVKIKFANIINIINNREIIPELIQKECNAKEYTIHCLFFRQINEKTNWCEKLVKLDQKLHLLMKQFQY